MNNEDYKILIVDDEDDILEFVSYNLRKEGYQVLTASNGNDAINVAKEQIPHLIILDIMMPGMDGYELLESLKKKDPSGEIPVIMLTARNNMKDKEKAISMGATDYLIKPIDIEDTINRVQRALRN